MTEKENNGPQEKPPQALSIPAQSPPPRDSFLLSPKEVRRWAEELPVANIGETARQVYNTLVTFNRIQIPTLTRTEIIEIFREPVGYIITNISRHYYNAGFPLPSKAMKAAQLANALCSEVANAYKILFLDQILGDEKSFNQKLIIVAAQRAIQYMGQKMFHNLLVYRDYPEGLWREANYLYAWAHQNEVVDVPVRESSGYPWNRKNSKSIDEVYKAMALMATTNPYRLRHSQMRRLHMKMPHWAQLAVIRPAHESSGNTGIFHINLWSDTPPSRSLNGMQRKDSRFLLLDLNPVLEEARAEFEAAEWESPAHLEKDQNSLSRTLLRPLIRHWTKALERRFPRTETRHEIEAIVGLSNLLRLLSEQREQEEAEKKAQTQPSAKKRSPVSSSSHLTWNDSVFSSLTLHSPVNPASGDSIFLDNTAAIGTMGEESEKKQGNIFQHNTRQSDTPFTVLSYNESVEGYCIGWKSSAPMRVRVGDVLGVRSTQNPDEFGVTVVRWLRQSREQELFLGLQVPSSSCAEVMISPSSKPSSNRQNQYRCLLLSNADRDGEERSLLTNTHVFKLDTVLTMNTEFGQHQIRLTRWIESNNNFVHYEFEYVDPVELIEQGNEEETSGF
ncbi:MAG TPA: hypothetical protein EYP90_04340, partial [Chromatiaceae bacterium]|nr:hypothetical protein [Chromatiaceae bacterium]